MQVAYIITHYFVISHDSIQLRTSSSLMSPCYMPQVPVCDGIFKFGCGNAQQLSMETVKAEWVTRRLLKVGLVLRGISIGNEHNHLHKQLKGVSQL